MTLQYTKHEPVSLRRHPQFSETRMHNRICQDTSILGLGELDFIALNTTGKGNCARVRLTADDLDNHKEILRILVQQAVTDFRSKS